MNRLKDLRKEKGLTQKNVAKVLDITPQAYGLYEMEKRDIPTEFLKVLSTFFNVSIDYIIGKSDFKNIDSNCDKIHIGLSVSDYENITDVQRKQIDDYARFVLKDNRIHNKD